MWFRFQQNNSGGWFQIDENMTVLVFIEADNVDRAWDSLENLGADFSYCECCGERWYKPYSDDSLDLGEVLKDLIYWQNTSKQWAEPKNWAILHFKDGRKLPILEIEENATPEKLLLSL